MKDVLIKNLHWFIIAYAAWSTFTVFEEKEEEYKNLVQQTPALQSKIAREKRNLSQIEEFKANLAETKDRVREVAKQIEKAQRQLPADVNDAQVQEMLGEVSDKLKMKQPKQSPLEETSHGFYFAKLYSFEAKGTFLQSLIFFETLAKSERILNVKNVEIKQSTEKTRSRFQVVNMKTTVESFRYNKNHVEKSGVEEIEKQFK